MHLFTLIQRELIHRPLSAGIQLLSISIAIAGALSIFATVNDFAIQTESIIAQKESDNAERMKKMEDDYRKITKKMGFNILILPKNQNLGDFYADDFATEYMPESYVHTLANSKIVTVQHLLPTLKQKITWSEHKRKIILVGVRDEVPLAHRDPKKPILHPVPPGSIALGFELHQSLDMKTGDKISLMGKTFNVHKCHKERGNKDDITAWIDLDDAQTLLNKEDQINGIMALECKCAFANLAKVRKEIAGILPDTQVLEFASQALARAEARQTAAQVAADAVNAEKQHRASMLQEKQSFAQIVIAVLAATVCLWIALLNANNVRERKSEIGILRAIGLSSMHILLIFMGKAFVIAVAASIAGIVFALIFMSTQCSAPISELISTQEYLLAVLSCTALGLFAAWLPALSASQQDPAQCLRAD